MNLTIPMVDAQNTDVITIIIETIRTVSAKAREVNITLNSRFLEELALDSLDMIAVILRVQDHYQVEIDPDELTTMTRVADLVAVLTKDTRTAA